jgi:hypothetical protein
VSFNNLATCSVEVAVALSIEVAAAQNFAEAGQGAEDSAAAT